MVLVPWIKLKSKLMKMDRQVLIVPAAAILIIFSLALPCDAASYTVGDSSGWDISTDLDTWPQGKTFYVGDVLVFQYSSSGNVEELSKEYYDNCTTTRALQSYSNGNTSIPLTRPGPWYFASGNRLYCLGGMKLQVNVESNSQAGSPAEAPGALTPPTTRSDNPFNPTSDAPWQHLPHPTCRLLLLLLVVSSLFSINAWD